MGYEVIFTEPFEKKAKRLIKKFPSLKEDLLALTNSLKENPFQGISLGHNCFKIRLAIRSKGKGKSGGSRVITYVRVGSEKVFMIDIYDKSEQESISDKELSLLINLLAQ